MNKKIVIFSNKLRMKGMDVSIRSTITASLIWNNYKDSFNTKELREAFRCVYVKDTKDNKIFNVTFNTVFNNKYIKNESEQIDYEEAEIISIQKKYLNKKPEKVSLDHTQETIISRRRTHKKIISDSILSDDIVSLDSMDSRVFNLCFKLSKKIANQRSKRKKREYSRFINIPKTIRANLKNGGYLIDLVNQKPPVRKSRHLFLCDISGSCEWATTWFFSMLYGCYKSFDKITVYDFDNRVVDVTEALYMNFSNSFQVNQSHQSMGLRPRGHSDMNKSFSEFIELADLNKQTDVIILTDCRDWTGRRVNGQLESAKKLKKIVKKSRHVYIFNPESIIRWNTPTSCVSDYQYAGAKVIETSTLNKFGQALTRL